jgi:4-hydroxy-2-oxoheptanedioate aldolase
MLKNTIRERWQQGQPVVNGWLTIPSAWSAEIMARQGWDGLTIDMQHGLMDYHTAVDMLRAINMTPTTPTVRVTWNEPGLIMRMLDAGAYGIICPMVNSRAEAERFVGACRYAPVGYRSVGPLRAALHAGSDYFTQANDSIVTLAMVETVEAIKNVEEIVSTPGLDAIYIGPSDLGLSLGVGPLVGLSNSKVLEAAGVAMNAALRHGVVAGVHVSSVQDGLRLIDMGFRFVTVMSDTRLLTMAIESTLANMRASKQPATTGPKTAY